ncbi:hypothetical protein HGA91_04210 [candidate division WWE3 bacterium]|nr:hypothetical protein [candidate division WWE3 bacterium]
MKTRKGVVKRVKLTGSKRAPKILRRKRVIGNFTKARNAAKRSNRKPVEIKTADRRVLKKLLPGI